MNSVWYKRGVLAYLLLPVSLVFGGLAWVRKSLYQFNVFKQTWSDVPVIVVGNLSVGGTGKTPIVAALVEKLKQAGYRPGIVSRGFGAVPARDARMITADTQAEWAGDEPKMLANQTNVPVCIGVKRADAVAVLLRQSNANVVISDDGMQHYAMGRDFEIAVVDGQRLLGNGWLVPAGPLREPASRLGSVDAIAIQHAQETAQEEVLQSIDAVQPIRGKTIGVGSFYLQVLEACHLADEQKRAVSEFAGQKVHAVAGIGNPSRFFNSLRNAGLDVVEHAMPDHHAYKPQQIQFGDDLPVLMTAKDAVKVRELEIDLNNMFEVNVKAVLDKELDATLDKIVSRL